MNIVIVVLHPLCIKFSFLWHLEWWVLWGDCLHHGCRWWHLHWPHPHFRTHVCGWWQTGKSLCLHLAWFGTYFVCFANLFYFFHHKHWFHLLFCQNVNFQADSVLKGSASYLGRFGSSLAVLPDLNADGFNDLAVGAPLENNGQGSIYIFHGKDRGRISVIYSQVSKILTPFYFSYLPFSSCQ